MRPHSNRVRSRASSVASSRGCLSDEMMICLPGLVQAVEGVEKLLLELVLAFDELNIID